MAKWKRISYFYYPIGKCGQITWSCPYDPTDPNCCEYVKPIEEYTQKLYKIAMDKEYGPERK